MILRCMLCSKMPTTAELKEGYKLCSIHIMFFIFILFLNVDLYMAPEVYNNQAFGRSIDCYSFGIILFEVIFYSNLTYSYTMCEQFHFLLLPKVLRSWCFVNIKHPSLYFLI